MQITDSSIKTKEDLMKYLLNPQEIMPNACQCICELIQEGYSKEDIVKFLISPKNDVLYNNLIFRTYFENLDNNSPVLKKFFKYLYLYLLS